VSHRPFHPEDPISLADLLAVLSLAGALVWLLLGGM